MAHFAKQNVDKYLSGIRQGDSSALSALYDLTAKPLYALCYTYTRNHYDSEDALSETYLALIKHIDGYKGKNGFNWIYTIAKNICLNMLRQNRRQTAADFYDEETVNTLHLPPQSPPRLDDESGIIALSQRVLNENEFRIVILHTVNRLKFKEIAQVVGGLESTVRWQYNNAVKKVKAAYEGGNYE